MYGKKNNGEKTNEMSESEVLSDENSTSSDVENDILEDLKPYQFEPEEEEITSVADTDKSEEECSEESDEECHSHSAIKEHVGNTTWCKCFNPFQPEHFFQFLRISYTSCWYGILWKK